jgi:enterochelin esterase-like enzyme
VLEPQSTALFVLLIVLFGALTGWMVVTRQPVFRLLAACLAFIPAMLFGVVAVNKYYGYYQTWGAAIADLTSQGGNTVAQVPTGPVLASPGLGTLARSDGYLALAQQQGYTLRLAVPGRRSHITRAVYVYLPPQYFQAAYRKYRFPVLELIHGQPGSPQDWINVVGVTSILAQLVSTRVAQPAVLVMPDANGAPDVSLQCLNQAGGPQDLTYLAQDLPAAISHLLRVQPPGPAWGVAGYSEGGFCAANMALHFRDDYGFAGVLSGYFKPYDNNLGQPSRLVNPFGGNKGLQQANTPLKEVEALPPGAVVPRFWLGAGSGDNVDVANTQIFWQALQLRQTDVPLTLTPGGGHSMITWRAEVPSMLTWMTPRLAAAARAETAARAAQAQARKASGGHLPVVCRPAVIRATPCPSASVASRLPRPPAAAPAIVTAGQSRVPPAGTSHRR